MVLLSSGLYSVYIDFIFLMFFGRISPFNYITDKPSDSEKHFLELYNNWVEMINIKRTLYSTIITLLSQCSIWYLIEMPSGSSVYTPLYICTEVY